MSGRILVQTSKPSEEELVDRVTTHVERRPGHEEAVSLAWGGYLAALVQWELITPEVYGRVAALLPEGSHSRIVGTVLGSGEEAG